MYTQKELARSVIVLVQSYHSHGNHSSICLISENLLILNASGPQEEREYMPSLPIARNAHLKHFKIDRTKHEYNYECEANFINEKEFHNYCETLPVLKIDEHGNVTHN